MLSRLRQAMSSPAVEQRSIHLAGTPITFTLKRSSKRRSIGLRIDDRGLTVSMPLRASEKWLHSVLDERAHWVVEKLHSWQSKKAQPTYWIDGEKIQFRGDTFTLHIIPSLFPSSPQIHGDELVAYVANITDEKKIEQVITQWYRREATKLFAECVAHFAPQLNVSPMQVKLSSAKTQWGSCTSRGIVRLNWQLVKMPLPLIDYVVIHELAHLIEMNHSERFWRIVEAACPDYKKHRAELRKYQLSE